MPYGFDKPRAGSSLKVSSFTVIMLASQPVVYFHFSDMFRLLSYPRLRKKELKSLLSLRSAPKFRIKASFLPYHLVLSASKLSLVLVGLRLKGTNFRNNGVTLMPTSLPYCQKFWYSEVSLVIVCAKTCAVKNVKNIMLQDFIRNVHLKIRRMGFVL